MANWIHKYRPRRFEEVLGQDNACDELAELVRNKRPASVALIGPTGVGKTTLARIYAQAIACEAPTPEASPCGACVSCVAIGRGDRLVGYQEVGPARQHTSAMRALVEGDAGLRVGAAARSVVILDDADELRGWRYLKAALEDSRARRVFVFAFDDLDRLPLPIRDRLQVFELRAPATGDLFNLVQRVCLAEQVTCEPEALRLIARGADNFRQAIIEVEALGRRGPITTSQVLRQAYSPRWAWLEDYLGCLGQADVGAQVQALRRSPLEPAKAVAALIEALVWLKTGVGDNPGLRAEARRLRVLRRFHDTAEALSLSTPVLWDIAASFWKAVPSLQSTAALEAAAIQFWHQVEAKRLGLSALGEFDEQAHVAETPVAPPRLAKASHKDDASAEHISWDQVVALYEAATFALQVYWAPFNTQIEVRWSQAAHFGPGGLSTRIDRFAQALQRRVEQLGCLEVGGHFTRLLLNEAEPDGRVVTTIVGHVPGRHRGDLERWLTSRALKGELSIIVPPQRLGIEASIELHWALLRRLWRGADPSLRIYGEVSVLDLLQVPRADRRPAARVPGRRFSASQNISDGAQRQLSSDGAPHLSAIAESQWRWIAKGWERHQFEARRRNDLRGAEMSSLVSRKSADAVTERRGGTQKCYGKPIDAALLPDPPWSRRDFTGFDLEQAMAEINPLFAELGTGKAV